MVARLVQANYFANQAAPTEAQVLFWLREMRDPALLLEVGARFSEHRATTGDP